MDFTNLQLPSGPDYRFTPDNKQLRKQLYIVFANTPTLQELFTDVQNRFQKYIDANLLRLNYKEDIINSFLVALKHDESKEEQIIEKLKVEIYVQPLLPAIKIAPKLKFSRQVVVKMDKIGYQHLNVLSKMEDSSESSSSTSDSEVPLAKKLKTCQKAIEVHCENLLESHMFNYTANTGTTVHVDILIYMKESYCKELSKYLGLIYIEGLLEEIEAQPFVELQSRLDNNNAKLYRLVQSYINKKLITGCNNICLVSSLILWENISANVRAYILNDEIALENLDVHDTSNVRIILGKEHSFLDYIEAVSTIIDIALNCECHVVAKYKCEQNEGQNLYSKVKLSLASFICVTIF